MIRFANGWLLWLLWLNLLILYFWYRRWHKPSTVVLPSLTRLRPAAVSLSLRGRLSKWLVLLRVLAFSCLVIALARPQAIAHVEQIKTEVIDIIITLDVSLSMGAQDFQASSRLSVAKSMIEKFINGRQADRLGLITFAAYSQLRCPLTLDYDILKMQLQQVDLVDRNDQEANGTAIGLSLASSVNHLRDSNAKSRVVVLLTDGDNNITTVEPQTAAEIARVIGVKVYAVGVGTTGMVPMPSRNPADPAGTYTLQQSGFNEDVLRQIATTTGGRYFRATDRQSLETIFREIDSLERTEVQVQRYNRYQELFWSWVIVAIVMLLTEVTLQHTYLRILP
ncbi:MAG: VWA domain-containing protein [Acidobacteriota bacterium]